MPFTVRDVRIGETGAVASYRSGYRAVVLEKTWY